MRALLNSSAEKDRKTEQLNCIETSRAKRIRKDVPYPPPPHIRKKETVDMATHLYSDLLRVHSFLQIIISLFFQKIKINCTAIRILNEGNYRSAKFVFPFPSFEKNGRSLSFQRVEVFDDRIITRFIQKACKYCLHIALDGIFIRAPRLCKMCANLMYPV